MKTYAFTRLTTAFIVSSSLLLSIANLANAQDCQHYRWIPFDPFSARQEIDYLVNRHNKLQSTLKLSLKVLDDNRLIYYSGYNFTASWPVIDPSKIDGSGTLEPMAKPAVGVVLTMKCCPNERCVDSYSLNFFSNGKRGAQFSTDRWHVLLLADRYSESDVLLITESIRRVISGLAFLRTAKDFSDFFPNFRSSTIVKSRDYKNASNIKGTADNAELNERFGDVIFTADPLKPSFAEYEVKVSEPGKYHVCFLATAKDVISTNVYVDEAERQLTFGQKYASLSEVRLDPIFAEASCNSGVNLSAGTHRIRIASATALPNIFKLGVFPDYY